MISLHVLEIVYMKGNLNNIQFFLKKIIFKYFRLYFSFQTLQRLLNQIFPKHFTFYLLHNKKFCFYFRQWSNGKWRRKYFVVDISWSIRLHLFSALFHHVSKAKSTSNFSNYNLTYFLIFFQRPVIQSIEWRHTGQFRETEIY